MARASINAGIASDAARGGTVVGRSIASFGRNVGENLASFGRNVARTVGENVEIARIPESS
jgi:hypothetical protein